MAKKKISQDFIVESYMNFVLKKSSKPKSVFELTDFIKIKEEEFYKHFGSMEGLEKSIFEILFEKTMKLLNEDKNFKKFDFKNKLLGFYYTFIENLTMNRSFVTMVLKNKLESIKTLSGLRTVFLKWINEESNCLIKNEKIAKIIGKKSNELYWMQFATIIAYWLKDESKELEKTDLFIEKSVNASFDLMNIKPPDSVLDFGKFLFKKAF